MNETQWLAEAEWVASAGGPKLAGIVARAPPGFGVPGVPASVIGAGLDQLVAIGPKLRGIRPGLNLSQASLPTTVAHVQELAKRGLSMDLNVNMASPMGPLAVALARACPSVGKGEQKKRKGKRKERKEEKGMERNKQIITPPPYQRGGGGGREKSKRKKRE